MMMRLLPFERYGSLSWHEPRLSSGIFSLLMMFTPFSDVLYFMLGKTPFHTPKLSEIMYLDVVLAG